MKELYLKLWYSVLVTHLTATLIISSKKDSKYLGVSRIWLLAIIITEVVPFRHIFSKEYASSIFSFIIFWLKELRLAWIAKNHCFFSNKNFLFIGSAFWITARDNYFEYWTWALVTCLYLDSNSLKEFSFGVAYNTRIWITINLESQKW